MLVEGRRLCKKASSWSSSDEIWLESISSSLGSSSALDPMALCAISSKSSDETFSFYGKLKL